MEYEPSEVRRKTGIGHVKATSVLAQRRKRDTALPGRLRDFREEEEMH